MTSGRVAVRARAGSTLRCAYCHGDLGAGEGLGDGAARCRACATWLHQDCWTLAAGCPVLGCGPARPRISVRPRGTVVPQDVVPVPTTGRSELTLGLAALTAIEAGLLVVVPPFDRMFTETGLVLPPPTALLVDLSRFAASPPGLVAFAALLGAAVLGWRRLRARDAAAGRTLATAVCWTGLLLAVASAMVGAWSLFLPLIQTTERL